MLTADKLTAITPAAKPYAAELVRQMAEAGILGTPKRAAMFLGQVHTESGGFKTVTESLNYSSTALAKIFGRHRISLADAEKFGRTDDHPAHQNALANILYGGEFGRKQLGNTEPGDGARFIGRGLKQLTGRANYRAFSRAWRGDESLLLNPEEVAKPTGAVASAVWFWSARGLNVVADRGTVSDVTRLVNGGQMGLPDREQWTKTYFPACA